MTTPHHLRGAESPREAGEEAGGPHGVGSSPSLSLAIPSCGFQRDVHLGGSRGAISVWAGMNHHWVRQQG